MSYTYNSSAINSAANANTITLSPPSGSLIAVYSVTSAGGGTPTVTLSDNGSGSVWANASNNVVTGSDHCSVAYCLSAGTGITTLTATYNGGTPGTCDLIAVCYTGLTSPSFVAVATPNGQTNPGTGANAITANALNCGSTNALMIVFSKENANHSNMAAGTGFTLRLNTTVGASDGLAVEDPAAEVTGSQTGTFTDATNGAGAAYNTISVAFADNTGGAAQIIMGQACL